MPSQFSEKETEKYYDAQDEIYRVVWDDEGSVHWGIFDESTGDDFSKAGINLNRVMIAEGQIDSSAKVLDIGCGNGTTAIWLCKEQGCHVAGIDLSGVRANNAVEDRARQAADVQARLHFEKASAVELPFADGSFSRLWSQATFYHVPDKDSVLNEAYRVLEAGGIMVFDDLIKPQPNISPDTQKHVYERLLYDTDFSFDSYQDALKSKGFKVLHARDISDHLKTSYLKLADRVPTDGKEHAEHYKELAESYRRTAAAVDTKELGWGLFVCQK